MTTGPVPATQSTPGGRAAIPPAELVLAWIGPVAGRTVLDVGCGGGGLARSLIAQGAEVTGIDPLPEALDAAGRAAPAAHLARTGAQALPFADDAFDAAVMLNALHHVPGPAMAAALAEALRVSRSGLLVVEPLAEGPFFETISPVEDETEIRAEAQAAIADAVAAGAAVLVRTLDFDDMRLFPDLDTVLARVVAVDPARAEAARRVRDEVAARFARLGVATAQGMLLPQPHRAHLLRRPPPDAPG